MQVQERGKLSIKEEKNGEHLDPFLASIEMIKTLTNWIDFMVETGIEAIPYLINRYPKTMLLILIQLIVLFTLNLLGSIVFGY